MAGDPKRLVRTQMKVRTDLWPEPPQLPQSVVARFPELQQFNDDFRLWAEQVRNSMEQNVSA